MASAEHQRNRRNARKLKGLCVYCGKNPKSQTTLACNQCAIKPWRIPPYSKEKRVELKRETFIHYGGAFCVCCGEDDLRFLSLDHINNDGAHQRRRLKTGINIYNWIKARGYPPQFQVLCMNCNFGKHINKGVCPHKDFSLGGVLGLAT